MCVRSHIYLNVNATSFFCATTFESASFEMLAICVSFVEQFCSFCFEHYIVIRNAQVEQITVGTCIFGNLLTFSKFYEAMCSEQVALEREGKILELDHSNPCQRLKKSRNLVGEVIVVLNGTTSISDHDSKRKKPFTDKLFYNLVEHDSK